MGDRYRIESFLPLPPALASILLGLAEGPAHGYALLTRIEQQSDGSVEMGTGQLYRHLRRVLDRGWVEEVDAPPDVERDDPRRRYYDLTDRGRAVLRAEMHRLRSQVGLSRRLGLLEDG